MTEKPLSDSWTFDQFNGSRSQFATVSLELLADHAASCSPNHVSGRAVLAEIKRREMLAQIEAAEATRDAAIQSRNNARWMKWSVFVAAGATVLAACFSAANLALAYGACHL
jgi:hypothetical protein